ncbi:MAG: DUF1211 domain-containing protein [Candidatus Eremiobacteraeota bacterium]|nr:DUF1211 domain-containing protein [Candidatus Eremiobacteraeota bacterium]
MARAARRATRTTTPNILRETRLEIQSSDAAPAERSAQAEHTLHRLEAFSDIVIAFTLSELALTLKVPDSSQQLLAHPLQLVRFLGSFALVCSLWWLHHRLFSRYVFPDSVTIVLNFAFLAAAAYAGYSFLLVSKLGDAIALGIYGLSIGAAYSILAVLYVKGIRDSRVVLDETQRADGAQFAIRVGFFGLTLLISSLFAVLGRGADQLATVWLIGVALVIFLSVRYRIARARRERQTA